jgi:hypothetical protein
MRLVLDTATMVAGIRSDRGASRRLLRMALEGRGFRPLISVPLLIEYEAVLTRPEHLKVARLTIDDIGVLLDAVAAVAERVELAFLWRLCCRMPMTTWFWKRRSMVVRTASSPSTDATLKRRKSDSA